MSKFGKVYDFSVNFGYMIKSNHNFKIKIKILLIYFKIILKNIFIARLFNLRSEKIFGFEIVAFDYQTIKFLFEEIFYRNEYVVSIDSTSPIFFDCGANIGFATIFLKWLYPNSKIYSFEPDLKTFELLKINVEKNNLKNVFIYNVAVSDYDGIIDFYIDDELDGSLIMSTIKERMSKKKVTVNCISLVNFIENNGIEKIDFAKIDIEGAELSVLKDLNKNKKLDIFNEFIIEYHHKINGHSSKLSEFLKVFEENNFEYQIDTRIIPISKKHQFQDVLLHFYKK